MESETKTTDGLVRWIRNGWGKPLLKCLTDAAADHFDAHPYEEMSMELASIMHEVSERERRENEAKENRIGA